MLLCFVCDPYQPLEKDLRLTRGAIETLNFYKIPVQILTKAGELARRDFDLLEKNPGNSFGTTLTLLDDRASHEWEPFATSPANRIYNLVAARQRNISTWVSLEPVIDPEATLEIIRSTHRWVGYFKVGTLNYHEHRKSIDWLDFGKKATALLDSLQKVYYIKKDLAQILNPGAQAGYWKGK